MTIRAESVTESLRQGDSVAVDGVCLTAVEVGREGFVADVSPETIQRSNQAYYQIGTAVNLERPLVAGSRMGGHFVQGHVDATLRSTEVREDGEFVWMGFDLSEELRPFLVEKGSVAINGVSLTVAALHGEGFDVQLVPHTLQHTNLSSERRAEVLNVEVDVLGKYVERMLRERFGVEEEDVAGEVEDRIVVPDALIELAGE